MLFVPKKRAREICKKLIEEHKIEASKRIDEAYAEYKRSQKNE